MNKLGEGTTWVFHIPNSWILIGTVAVEDDSEVTFKDAVYVETIGTGHSALGSIAGITTQGEASQVITRGYRITKPLTVKRDAIIMRIQCNIVATASKNIY